MSIWQWWMPVSESKSSVSVIPAVVCVVDNLANGIAAEPLSVAEFEAGKERNRALLTSAIDAVAADLGGTG